MEMGQERQVLQRSQRARPGSPASAGYFSQSQPSPSPLKDFFRGMGLAGGATIGVVIAIILIICITCFSCAFISGFRDDGAFQNTIEQIK